MPIWLRKFTLNKLREFYQAKQEQEKSQLDKIGKTSALAKGPDIKPSYTSKASTK